MEKKKKREFPNTYVIIFFIILICAAATWIVPGGEYVESEAVAAASGSARQQAGSAIEFEHVQAQGQWWQVFSTFYNGFVKQAGIIVFILVIGAAFWIVNKSRAIDAGIFSFLKVVTKLGNNRLLSYVGVENIVIVLVMLLFSLFGAVFGMSEETIAFVIIVIPLAISMGYDSIVGVCMVYVAAHVGFAGAILNPFTIGIAQDLAQLPLFSGIEYRLFCWVVLNVILIAFVLLYARKVKRNPTSSPMYELDAHWRNHIAEQGGNISYYRNGASWFSFAIAAVAVLIFTAAYSSDTVLSIGTGKYHTPWLLPVVALLFIVSSVGALRKSVHFYILTLLGFTIIYLIVGVLGYQWYIGEISALFLALGIFSGIAMDLSANKIVNELMAGAKDILSAALIVGLAAGIVYILEEGRIIDTILHAMASGLGEAGEVGSLGLMYGIQTVINLVIPSASAKAAITMPIMAPFSDIIGVSRQATVLAFQFGDGFTNMITPTSGVLIAVLGIARIPYGKWFKWILPLILILVLVGFLLLIPTVFLQLSGF
ncbi:MAG: YfcC family protein [Bacteroidales bacterium]|nr:YfcC family protein [Bacteroidales bacterium]